MTVTPNRRLVLVVDGDAAFVEDSRVLLQEERVLTARTIDEAAEIVAGGRVDLVLLGPSFGSESSVVEAATLRASDPEVVIVLAASIITNRILLGAMRSGITDVLDTPLTLRKIGEVMSRVGSPKAPPTGAAPSARAAASSPEALRIDTPVVTISFEAESGSSTSSSFSSGGIPPRQPILPAGGPIDEPSAAAPSPPAQAWVVPVPQTPPSVVPEPTPPPPPVAVVPDPSQVAPQPPAPPPVAPPPPAPSGMVPPSWEPTTPVAPPAPAPSAREVGLGSTVVYPPPPASPPPMRSEEPKPRPPARTDGPVDLERVGLLPADGPRRPPRRGGGQVVAVMAGKGGSGKTITATNLSLALTFQHGEDSVVLVDADIQFGDVALMLQLDPSRTLTDAVDRLDELSDARLDGMLLRHESGLRVMPAPVLPTSEERLPAKGIVEVIERLRGMYRFVIVDTPPIFDDHLVTILETADEVLAVVDMDLPSVKNAKIALDALRSSRFPMERMRLVVNRVNAKARLDLVELERSLGLRVAGSIPSDRLVPQSVNEGIPVVALSPRSRVARSFHTLAQMLTPDEREPRRH
ncbi:MAG: hypothetical protein A2Z12_08655 [Actinobacteria bacterium RBG_16_68_21]|nr:MAG: hypothetical protein A2Z12_08655 [Actinobacteria bacterium RBG_16_68_21]